MSIFSENIVSITGQNNWYMTELMVQNARLSNGSQAAERTPNAQNVRSSNGFQANNNTTTNAWVSNAHRQSQTAMRGGNSYMVSQQPIGNGVSMVTTASCSGLFGALAVLLLSFF